MWSAPDGFFNTLFYLAIIGLAAIAVVGLGAIGLGVWFIFNHIQLV